MIFVYYFCAYMLYTVFTYNHSISSLPMLFLITGHYPATFRLTFLVHVHGRDGSVAKCYHDKFIFLMIDKTPFYIQTTVLLFTCCCARSLVPYLCYHDYCYNEHKHSCLHFLWVYIQGLYKSESYGSSIFRYLRNLYCSPWWIH